MMRFRAWLIAVVAMATLASCSRGGSFLGFGVLDPGPPLSEDEVATMLAFEQYINNSFLARQRLSTCENFQSSYNQLERSLRAELSDSSSIVVDVVAAQRTNLRTVSASRQFGDEIRVQATFRHTGPHTDSIEVRLWRSAGDRRPDSWYVPRQGPIGTKLVALGRRTLAITCRTRLSR